MLLIEIISENYLLTVIEEYTIASNLVVYLIFKKRVTVGWSFLAHYLKLMLLGISTFGAHQADWSLSALSFFAFSLVLKSWLLVGQSKTPVW